MLSSQTAQHSTHGSASGQPPSRSICSAACKRSQHRAAVNSFVGAASCLRQLGLSDQQAAAVLTYYTRRCLRVNTANVALWLQLLRSHGVERPVDVVAGFPIILESRADNVTANAAAVVQWLSDKELTQACIAELLCRQPKLLCIPSTNFEEMSVWLRCVLGWTDSMVTNVLVRHARLFGSNPLINLAPKLPWFYAIGFSSDKLSKVLYRNPALLSVTTARNERQLSALQATGLTLLQSLGMVRKQPQLLTLNIAGPNIQAKLCFLTHVMGKQVTEILNFPAYLTYSLFSRIGPRWAFHSVHLQGKNFNLSMNLTPSDEQFATGMKSCHLDTECSSCGMTRLQLYQRFISQWQLGEGIKWNGFPKTTDCKRDR